MGHSKKRVAFIPVRGGSKSIPKKNIKEIAGQPLVYWVINAAIQSKIFDDIYISTDDRAIAHVVEKHVNSDMLTLIKRSPETATDSASTESAMLEFAQLHDFEYITLIQATSPLLQAKDLKTAHERIESDEQADSLISVCRQERFIWQIDENGYGSAKNYDVENRPRRQDFDGYLVENGALYITERSQLLKFKNRLSGNILCYEMAPETYYELDEPEDWTIIEHLLNNRKKRSHTEKLKKIKLFLTDVDGVLTDAGMYYSEKGDELKKFNTRDGKGLELLRNAGIQVGIITSEDTQIVADRANKLKVNILHQGIQNKGKTLNGIIAELGISRNEVAYIGDDVNDLSIIKEVGFSACPADAIKEVREQVDYICCAKGGNGCVREFSNLILNK